MDKKQSRLYIRNRLLQFPQSIYEEKSAKIAAQLLQLPSIKEGKTIALTISIFPEVDTYNIIRSLWNLGKCVVVPKCEHATRSMKFYEITSFDQLEPAKMGLLEPNINLTKWISSEHIDVCIVPGIVFDYKGYRIGYGGGYYDRFLPTFHGKKLALAFHEQLVEEVPTNEYDMKVDLLITDQQQFIFTDEG